MTTTLNREPPTFWRAFGALISIFAMILIGAASCIGLGFGIAKLIDQRHLLTVIVVMIAISFIWLAMGAFWMSRGRM